MTNAGPECTFVYEHPLFVERRDEPQKAFEHFDAIIEKNHASARMAGRDTLGYAAMGFPTLYTTPGFEPYSKKARLDDASIEKLVVQPPLF
jgi:hypothetical protein